MVEFGRIPTELLTPLHMPETGYSTCHTHPYDKASKVVTTDKTSSAYIALLATLAGIPSLGFAAAKSI